MVVVMEPQATEEQIGIVSKKLEDFGFSVHKSVGASQTVLGAIGDKRGIDLRDIEIIEGVREVLRITEPYKLVSRIFKKENTVIKIGSVIIGGDEVVMMAGPCSVESKEQIHAVAEIIKKGGRQNSAGRCF